MVDEAIAARISKENSLEDKTLDELDELEDDEDDQVVQEYRWGEPNESNGFGIDGRWHS